MTRRKNIDQLAERDMEILYQINNLRFVTMEQFRMISGYGKSYTFEKSREYERVGAITKKEVRSGHLYKRSKKGIYIALTQKAMTHIYNHGYTVTSTARINRNLKIDRILSILKVNDLLLSVKPYNWRFLDGRDAKRRYNVNNRSSLLHALLISPHQQTEYGVYMLMAEDSERTITTIKEQVDEIPTLTNYIIATANTAGVLPTVKHLDSETVRIRDRNLPKLQVGGKLRVLPEKFARYYLPISKDNPTINKTFIENLGFQILVDMDNEETVDKNNLSKRKFDYVVRFSEYQEEKGEDFYLANLLDNDLTQIRNIAAYSEAEYKQDGRKVIVLTTQQHFHKSIHELYVYGNHFIFHPIKSKYIVNAKNWLYPDVKVPERTLKKRSFQPTK